MKKRIFFSVEDLKNLSVEELCIKYKCSISTVVKNRAKYKIKVKSVIQWEEKNNSLLGTMPDLKLSRLLNVHPENVRRKRLKLGIESFHKTRLNQVTNEQLLEGVTLKELSKKYDVPEHKMRRELIKRGLLKEKKSRKAEWKIAILKQSAIAGMAFCKEPMPTLEEMGYVVGLSKQRVLQILRNIKKRVNDDLELPNS